MNPDLRYERPCRWLLAVGAGINWIAAMLVISNRADAAPALHYARIVEPLLDAIARAFS